MASIYDLKPRFQQLQRPMVGWLASAGITANQVTVAALLLSAATGLILYLWPTHTAVLLLLPLVLFVRMALNAMDGMLAREHDMQSNLGQILNELGDVLADAMLYLPLALVPGFNATLVVAIVVLAIGSEMTGVIMQSMGATRRYDGPMGKSDRAFVFGALGFFIGLGLPTGVWLTWLLAAVMVLALYTVVNRARHGLAELDT